MFELDSRAVILPEEKLDYGEKGIIAEMFALKESTGLIDMGCDIRDGLCVNRREYIYDNPQMCCCRDCAPSSGYLIYAVDKQIVITEAQYATYMKHYDHELGFWRPDKGCILDRKDRSIVCVCYQCKYMGPLRTLLKYIRLKYTELDQQLITTYANRVGREASRKTIADLRKKTIAKLKREHTKTKSKSGDVPAVR